MKSPQFVTAVTITPDALAVKADIHRAEELKTLQGLVGGYIDAVASEDNTISVFINDEGAINGMPVNELATGFWWAVNPAARASAQYLHGTAVVAGGPDSEGETTNIPNWIAEAIINLSRALNPNPAG